MDVFLRHADVVKPGPVFELLADNQIDERVFAFVDGDSLAVPLEIGLVLIERVDDAELFMALLGVAADRQLFALDSLEGGGGLGQAIGPVGRVIVVRGNRPFPVLEHDAERLGLGLGLVEGRDANRRRFGGVEVAIERLADLGRLQLLRGDFDRGTGPPGEKPQDKGDGDISPGASGFVHKSMFLAARIIQLSNGAIEIADLGIQDMRNPLQLLFPGRTSRSGMIPWRSSLTRIASTKIPRSKAGIGGRMIASQPCRALDHADFPLGPLFGFFDRSVSSCLSISSFLASSSFCLFLLQPCRSAPVSRLRIERLVGADLVDLLLQFRAQVIERLLGLFVGLGRFFDF